MAKKEEKTSKWKEGLKKRLKESNERASGGSGFFLPNLENVSFWKCDSGEHLVDVVPYFAGENDPNTKKGDPAYVLELYVHYGIGTDKRGVAVCNAKTYNKPCPICEHVNKMILDGEEEEVTSPLKAKRRCIYNIISYDSGKEEEKGVQIWDVAHWFSENHFQGLARKPVRRGKSSGDPFIYYMDPEEGKTLGFVKEGKQKSTKYKAHRFVDRDYSIEQDVLDTAHCLDELINILSYDEVYRLYWGVDSDGDEEVETPSKKHSTKKEERKKKPVINEDEEDIDDEEEEEEKPKAKSKVKKKPEPEPDDEDDDDLEEDEEDEEDEDDEEEEEEKAKSKVKKNVCDDFGISPDDFEECESCDQWDLCVDAKSKSSAPAKRKRK